jgi:outer membrane protein OmpA-like peptidoglycan-associated protein
MFPRLALLPIGLFAIWCFVCSKWYVCHIKHLCDTEQPTAPIPPSTVDDRALVFKWDSPTPVARATFEAFKQGQINALGEGQLLEITGNYYTGETAPEGFANMGLARAASVKAMFQPPLTDEQFVSNSSLIDPAPEGIQGDTLFEAITFRTKTPPPPESVECIVNNDNSLTILFPYGAAEREVDEKIEECLNDIISLINKQGGQAHIVGHTDDAGGPRFNLELGQKRADHIKAILVKNGVDSSSITTESKGESQPVADNSTEEGSRLNRRAVLTITTDQPNS